METRTQPEPNQLLSREEIAIKLEERRGLLMLLRAKERELKLLGWKPYQEGTLDKSCDSR